MTEGLKAAARARVGSLVQSFQRHEADYLRATDNETQARTDFITPPLKAFGWGPRALCGVDRPAFARPAKNPYCVWRTTSTEQLA